MTDAVGRCADLADLAGDPSVGTAPPAQRWLLVEHPEPWGRATAYTDSRLHPDAVATLAAWAGPAYARVVLIRRPGRRASGTWPRRWFRVDARPGHESIRGGTFDEPAALTRAVHDAGGVVDPLTLVCTHGGHDACCAIRGRPVVAAMAAADPERTWECSHLGGCRFAPAVVVLPHGFTFGGVPVADAAGLVRDYRRGVVATHRLRGRSSFDPAVQAAQNHARERTGATGVDDLRPATVTRTDDGEWRVAFTGPECTVRVRERFVPVDRPLTCAGRTAGRMRVFDPVD